MWLSEAMVAMALAIITSKTEAWERRGQRRKDTVQGTREGKMRPQSRALAGSLARPAPPSFLGCCCGLCRETYAKAVAYGRRTLVRLKSMVREKSALDRHEEVFKAAGNLFGEEYDRGHG